MAAPKDKSKQTSIIQGELPDDDELTEEQREAKALMLDMDTRVNEVKQSLSFFYFLNLF